MHANTRTILWKTSYLGLALVWALYGTSDVVWSAAEAPAEPKSIGKTCGKCPDGYATTGVTQSPEICKEGDATLVQCVPLGVNMLPVCGSCPAGCRERGSAGPARRDVGGAEARPCQLVVEAKTEDGCRSAN